MLEFFARYRNVSVLVAVLFLQFILLGYQVKRNADVRVLRVWTVAAITPIEIALNAVSSSVTAAWQRYVWLVGTGEQNRQLREQVSRLKLENQEFRRALTRLGREAGLVEFQKRILSESILAEAIGRGSNPNSKEIFLDKGSRHGVKSGMPVITPDGIAGNVQAAYGGASLVRLITDADAGVGIVLEGSRARGVMKGTGSRECRIDYIGNEIAIEVGEKVFTSGDDRIYPKGLVVGEVTRLEAGAEFQLIYVRPFADLDRLDDVLILTVGIHEEIPEFPRPQPPEYLMPVPPPSQDEAGSGEFRGDDFAASREESPAEAAGEGPRRKRPAPRTDADRLMERYRAIGAAQGHRFGEGEPGTPPPDFNIGLIPSAGFGGRRAPDDIAASRLPPRAERPAGSRPASESSVGDAVASASSTPLQALQSSVQPSEEVPDALPAPVRGEDVPR